MLFYYSKKSISFRKKINIEKKESKGPNTLFRMEAVYLLLRLKSRRKSSKGNWREMLNLGHAGHQHAVSVVF